MPKAPECHRPQECPPAEPSPLSPERLGRLGPWAGCSQQASRQLKAQRLRIALAKAWGALEEKALLWGNVGVFQR